MVDNRMRIATIILIIAAFAIGYYLPKECDHTAIHEEHNRIDDSLTSVAKNALEYAKQFDTIYYHDTVYLNKYRTAASVPYLSSDSVMLLCAVINRLLTDQTYRERFMHNPDSIYQEPDSLVLPE